MTEESHGSPDLQPAASSQVLTLRQVREAAGLPLAALAATLKVPVERLLALEEGRYQDLPNLTFARALASSVCRALKVDPAPVLRGLPQASDIKLGRDSPMHEVVDMPSRRGLPSLPSFSLRSPRAWAVVLLVLAVALWWWLPQRDDEAPLWPQVTPAAPPSPATDAGLAPPAAVTVEPIAVPPSAAPAVSPVQTAPQSQSAAVAAAGSVASAASAAVPTQPAVSQPLLQLRARETTWIQLKDSTGKELSQRTLQPGQNLDYHGQGPVQVVLGRAGGVEVLVHGQPFDTSVFAPNKVARFEVK